MHLGVQFYSEIIVFSTFNFEITGTIDINSQEYTLIRVL